RRGRHGSDARPVGHPAAPAPAAPRFLPQEPRLLHGTQAAAARAAARQELRRGRTPDRVWVPPALLARTVTARPNTRHATRSAPHVDGGKKNEWRMLKTW